MRYAVFTDIHANLEALEAVLAKIDQLAAKEPIDQIWFLGDLVGYGPDPNECILKLRERTDIIIAGNHDWAAVGKIDLEDFSPAARISAEWTAEQLTEAHRKFLANLPERLEVGECTLVHGSPYGPLWEYLTDEALAERSFQYFPSRFCFVGHTHVPVIFQQPDAADTPTLPLGNTGEHEALSTWTNGVEYYMEDENSNGDDETTEMAIVLPPAQQMTQSAPSSKEDSTSAFVAAYDSKAAPDADAPSSTPKGDTSPEVEQLALLEAGNWLPATAPTDPAEDDDETAEFSLAGAENPGADDQGDLMQQLDFDDYMTYLVEEGDAEPTTSESEIAGAEERLNSEIEELLTLLGLSQSMIQVTNEMLTPPEGHWEAPTGYRAIVNPGGVGQPRDGDPRAAFMIYDSKRGFEFYRVPYDFEKTQEKIIKADLPQFLAVRLQYGR